MNVYPIPDSLAAAYKGAGYALAALKSGRVVDLIYLRDILPEFSDKDEAGNGTAPDRGAAFPAPFPRLVGWRDRQEPNPYPDCLAGWDATQGKGLTSHDNY